MTIRQTKYQLPRGARADAETWDKISLVKNVSVVRATYQIRILALKAVDNGKKLVIYVPKRCKIDRTLRDFAKDFTKVIRIEKIA